MKIKAIHCVLGEVSSRIEEAAVPFDVTPAFLEEKIGVTTLHKLIPGQDASDLAVKAALGLIEKTSKSIDELDGAILCTQNGDGEGLPQTSAIVQAKLGLRQDIPCFDIALGCSGYVYSLQVAKSFAQSLGLQNVLVLTVDPYSKIVDSSDKNTALLFSDGASATLLSVTGQLSMGSTAFGTVGVHSNCLIKEKGRLKMNGREVFNCVLDTTPKEIERVLADEGVDKTSVDAFLFHQGSKFIVDSLRKRMRLAPEQVPMGIRSGNTVSSSIPFLLQGLIDDERQNRMILSGFGVGFSSATMFVSRG